MNRVIYGKITSYRHRCPQCGKIILSNDGNFQCDCDFSNKITDHIIKKTEIEAIRTKRQQPSAYTKKEIFTKQNGKCYWCGRILKSLYITANGKVRRLGIHWDHAIPFSFEQRNRDDNWVASCSFCNQFKSDYLFKNDLECKEFLQRKWDKFIKRESIEFLGLQ